MILPLLSVSWRVSKADQDQLGSIQKVPNLRTHIDVGKLILPTFCPIIEHSTDHTMYYYTISESLLVLFRSIQANGVDMNGVSTVTCVAKYSLKPTPPQHKMFKIW